MTSSSLSKKLNVAVIGLGWWGPKLLRNFLAHSDIGDVVGCDSDKNRRNLISAKYRVKAVGDIQEVLEDSSISALVIATPPASHYSIANSGLKRRKHILLTKPPTLTLSELQDLVKKSERNGVTVMLDSAFLYAPAAKRMKSIVGEASFAKPTSAYSFRHGNDLHFHHIERLRDTMLKNGIDVVEDLLFHDLAFVTYLFAGKCNLESIRRFNNIDPHLCDTAFVDLRVGDLPVHISLSWTLPERKRQFAIFARDKYILFDDLREDGKLRLFEFETKIETEVLCEKEEPLFCEVDHFINCITHGKKPLTNGDFMLEVMEIYEKVKVA